MGLKPGKELKGWLAKEVQAELMTHPIKKIQHEDSRNYKMFGKPVDLQS